jgi:hypothetical protein
VGGGDRETLHLQAGWLAWLAGLEAGAGVRKPRDVRKPGSERRGSVVGWSDVAERVRVHEADGSADWPPTPTALCHVRITKKGRRLG